MKKFLIVTLAIGILLISGCTKNQHKEIIDNLFFFEKDVTQISYNSKILFNNIIKKEVKLNIEELAKLKYGNLYMLKLDSIEGVPNERLNLGYFYVQKDKIYKFAATEENLNILKSNDEMPEGSIVVCQETEIKDILEENEKGFHSYLVVNKDKREYHSYNNQVSTGYYESFVWEKNKGLISYRSGYGAEKDSIEIAVKQ